MPGREISGDFLEAALPSGADADSLFGINNIVQIAGIKDITLNNLTLARPDGEVLVQDFSMTLRRGDRMILTGPSGCGKSTLLKALVGLWDKGHGTIHIPASDKILFEPQDFYMPLLSLRGILCYPEDDQTYDPLALESVLKAVGLARLIPDLENESQDGAYWSRTLSGGEKQKLRFARILAHKPDILILDEVTSSLDEDSEYQLYKMMVEALPQTTIISIAHRKKIMPFHTIHAVMSDKKIECHSLENPPVSRTPVPI